MLTKNKIVGRILAYFVRGLILVAPLYFTVMLIVGAIKYLDGILPIYLTVGKQQVYLPGVGLTIIIAGVIMLGFAVSTFIPQSLLSFVESWLKRLPLVNLIYSSIKDLITAFVGDKRKFNQPVLVVINRETGIKKLGFITQTDLKNFNLSDHVSVYCPHSYAFSGELFIAPISQVSMLDISSSDAMKMIVSGGVSTKS